MESYQSLGTKEDWTRGLIPGGEPSGFDPEADIPVPDRLLPKWKNRILLSQLKLSQKIGLLLYLNRLGRLSRGGQDRLLFLQSKAPLGAIEAGLKFCSRLLLEEKLQSDFKHQMVELNRPSQSKRFRRFQSRRIGVGYRDKGTLPEESELVRNSAQEKNFLFLSDLSPEIRELVIRQAPKSVEGEWLDLEGFSLEILSGENLSEFCKLLSLL